MSKRGWILGLLGIAIAGCSASTTGGGDGGIDAPVIEADADGNDAFVPTDSGTGADAPSTDDASPPADAFVEPDGFRGDAGPLCEGMTRGVCTTAGVGCECCPAGGPAERCLCTTTCTMDSDCTDPARPRCNQESPGSPGICTPAVGFVCAWGAVCASPTTPIATPTGERAIADLAVGDLVYTVEHGVRRAVPIREVGRQYVSGHVIVRVTLAGGEVIEMSEGHPTADGRFFRDLVPGDRLGDEVVVGVELAPYAHDATYDILPDGETGTYVAGGALVGSTLAR